MQRITLSVVCLGLLISCGDRERSSSSSTPTDGGPTDSGPLAPVPIPSCSLNGVDKGYDDYDGSLAATLNLQVSIVDSGSTPPTFVALNGAMVTVRSPSGGVPQVDPTELSVRLNGCELDPMYPPPTPPGHEFDFDLPSTMSLEAIASARHTVEIVLNNTLAFRDSIDLPGQLPNIVAPASGDPIQAGANMTWTPMDWNQTAGTDFQASIGAWGTNRSFELSMVDDSSGLHQFVDDDVAIAEFVTLQGSMSLGEHDITIRAVRAVNR